MKANFVNRTGKENKNNIADEIEKILSEKNMKPASGKIPWSTMNRLLSSEVFRHRVGCSFAGRKLSFTHNIDASLSALAKIANDLAAKRVVLGDLWDTDGKTKYLDKLAKDGLLPTDADKLSSPAPATSGAGRPARNPKAPTKPKRRDALIPDTDFDLPWPGRLHRHKAIWHELQHELTLSKHVNAISILFRVLLEISVTNYVEQTRIAANPNEKFSARIMKVAADLASKSQINQKYHDEIKRFQQKDDLFSTETLHRYVHSANLAPSPEHLTAMWDTLSVLIVFCLKA